MNEARIHLFISKIKNCWKSLLSVSLQVPAHLQNSWESYYMEILMVTGLLAYIMNYIIGKNKNSRLAQAWFNSHRELLESNFALVGEYSQLWLLLCYYITTVMYHCMRFSFVSANFQIGDGTKKGWLSHCEAYLLLPLCQ